MAQYDSLVIKSGIPTILGTDTLRADRGADRESGWTTTGLAAGDAVQVSAALTLQKAVNTSTSPIVGIYDGVTGSVVQEGVVVATFSGSVPVAGSAVYLSATAGQLTGTKPVKDVLHEVGVVVDTATSKILLQRKPVIALPPSPELSVYFADYGYRVFQVNQAGTLLGTFTGDVAQLWAAWWDGNYVWASSYPGVNPTRYVKFDATTRAQIGGPWSIGYHGDAIEPGHSWCFDGTNYWTTGYDNYSVIKFDGNGNVLATVTGLGSGYGHGVQYWYDGVGSIIVPIPHSTTIYKIDTTTNISTPYTPHAYFQHGPAYGTVYNGHFYMGVCSNSWGTGACYIRKIRISDMVDVGGVSTGTDNWPFKDLIIDGTYLYARNRDDNILYKYRLSDWAQVAAFPQYLVRTLRFDGTYIWTASSRFLIRINPVDGSYVNLGVYVDNHQGIFCNKAPLPWP